MLGVARHPGRIAVLPARIDVVDVLQAPVAQAPVQRRAGAAVDARLLGYLPHGRLRQFLDGIGCPLYSEHLSACSDDQGQLYDLLPLPFNRGAVEHVASRIRNVQDALGRRIAVENISYYATLLPQDDPSALRESDFINEVVSLADCDLLLDINNIIVNATNHRYDPVDFLHAMPGERIAYLHVAGHYDEADDLKIDTHGAPVSDPVWDLLEEAYRHFGPRATLLERDFNLLPLDELLGELAMVRSRLAPLTHEGRRHVA